MLKKPVVFLALLAAMATGTSVARADLLLPTGPNTGGPVTGESIDIGSVVDSLTTSFSNGGTIVGTYNTLVIKEEGESTLTFMYQVVNSGTDALTRTTVVSYHGAGDVYVGYATSVTDLPGSFVVGTQAPVSASRSNLSSTIGFNFVEDFSPTLDPGETSLWLFVRTNLDYYGAGEASVQDGGSVEGIDTLAPVPEPTSILTLGIGIGLAGVAGWRRRRQAV